MNNDQISERIRDHRATASRSWPTGPEPISRALLTVAAMIFAACGGGQPQISAPPTAAVASTATPVAERPAIDAEEAALLESVRTALDQGVDVNGNDQQGRTPLMMAAFDGHTEVVRLLLERGAEIDQRDQTGRTALMYASSGPFSETASSLLYSGADPDLIDEVEGWSALMFAAGEGHLPVVQVLVGNGASPTLKDQDGDQAIDHARANSHNEVVEYLMQVSSPAG